MKSPSIEVIQLKQLEFGILAQSVDCYETAQDGLLKKVSMRTEKRVALVV
jgi:hypothetical protein